MSTSRALITGCGLTVNVEFSIWEDLWQVGDCYVFCGSGREGSLLEPFEEGVMQLLVNDTFHQVYFERRQIYVIPMNEAKLNPAALAYLLKDLL